MYRLFRDQCEKLLRIPPEPEAPPGDEASTRLFRAAPNFYKYMVAIWGLQTALALAICSASFVAVIGVLHNRRHTTSTDYLFLIIPMLALIVIAVERLFSVGDCAVGV